MKLIIYIHLLFLVLVLSVSCGGNDERTEKSPTVIGGGTKDSSEVKTDPNELYSWNKIELVSKVEAEQGQYSGGVSYQTDVSGYEGAGYLKGFWTKNSKLTVKVTVSKHALYRIVMRYHGAGGNSQYLSINNEPSNQLALPVNNGFSDLNMGSYPLKAGENVITYQGDWGDVWVDNFKVYTVPKSEFNVDKEPIDKNASANTRKLYDFLCTNFGQKIISGYLNGSPVNGVSDRLPMLYSWEFMSYTEGYPYKWDNATGKHVFGIVENGDVEKAIDWYTSTGGKGVVSFQWHWCPPSGASPGQNTFYTNNTTFDVREAVKSGTEANKLILRDIDDIARQLKKLADKDIPVLFRPLHEAGGAWFWWGAKGAEPCLALYDILQDRLMNQHQLHNLLWVWSTPEENWYPGNTKVDVFGYDSYPGEFNYSPQYFAWNRLYTISKGQKILAMSENGAIPNIDDCLNTGAPWAYFVPWNELLYSNNTTDHIRDVYTNKNVLSITK